MKHEKRICPVCQVASLHYNGITANPSWIGELWVCGVCGSTGKEWSRNDKFIRHEIINNELERLSSKKV